MPRGRGRLLTLSPVKIPSFLYFTKGAGCLWIIRVSLMFGSVETSPTALSNQRINKASEGMISSRCFYSALPNSFSGLCLCYLYPVSPGTLNYQLPPTSSCFRCLFLYISVLDLILSYRIAAIFFLIALE